MTRDRSDAIVVRYEPAGRAPRRLVFEPLSDGAFERIEEVWDDNQAEWHRVGGERVEHVLVDTPADRTDETITGP